MDDEYHGGHPGEENLPENVAYGQNDTTYDPARHSTHYNELRAKESGDSKSEIETLKQMVLELQSRFDNLRFKGTATCNDDGTITLTGDIQS